MPGNTKPEDDMNNPNPGGVDDDDQKKGEPEITPAMQALIDAKADEKLKQMKANIDKAHKAREVAEAKATALENEKREAEIARLTEEGKHREAFDIQLAEEKAARTKAEQRNIELTRDIELRNALAAHEFRSPSAAEMAYRELVTTLVQNESGAWMHKSGASVSDATKAFAGLEDNAFLFKQKPSSGGGGAPPSAPPKGNGAKKSLFAMTQAEVLALAAEGQLGKR